jgi:hypothetical protein
VSEIIGIKGDGDILSIEDASQIYGVAAIQGVITDDGCTYLDEEGNELYPVTETDIIRANNEEACA